MSQILTVQINEQTYGAIRAEAEASGIAPSQVATETLERYFRNGQTRTEREKQAARERFERHFGEIWPAAHTGRKRSLLLTTLC